VEASPGPQSPPQPAAPGPQSPTGAFVEVPAPAMVAPTGAPLASVGKRFGGFLLDVLLAIVTLGIGWLVWLFVIMGRGQTPAKQLLHMRVVREDNGLCPSYGKMLVREFPARWIVGILAPFTLYIIYLWPVWDDKNQELWDKMVNTVVVDDPEDQLDPRKLAA
jgi:uncharacterized RDD family membrane protein YckC